MLYISMNLTSHFEGSIAHMFWNKISILHDHLSWDRVSTTHLEAQKKRSLAWYCPEDRKWNSWNKFYIFLHTTALPNDRRRRWAVKGSTTIPAGQWRRSQTRSARLARMKWDALSARSGGSAVLNLTSYHWGDQVNKKDSTLLSTFGVLIGTSVSDRRVKWTRLAVHFLFPNSYKGTQFLHHRAAVIKLSMDHMYG